MRVTKLRHQRKLLNAWRRAEHQRIKQLPCSITITAEEIRLARIGRGAR